VRLQTAGAELDLSDGVKIDRMSAVRPFFTLAIAVIVSAFSSAACRVERTAASSGPAPAGQAVAASPPAQASGPRVDPVVKFTPPPPAYNGPLPPFPTSPYAAPRPPGVVEAVYTFAARHPEVLHYVPCFCGCQRSGHSDNDDCFIKGRDAMGRPEWEPHGMT
jgi:hypothetical protein